MNTQLVGFVEALSFMKREDLETLVDHNFEFDGVLASHPAIARHVEKTKQDHDAKDEALEKYRGMHQQLVGMTQKLIALVWESDDEEVVETRVTPC